MDKKTVTHSGIIKKVENGKAIVSIVSKASCISCSLNNICSASDLKEKEIEVDTSTASEYRKGEEVTVELKQSAGNWAVVLGYFFPFLVLFIGLIIFINLGLDQGLAGVLAIALLIPYYGILFLFKDYFRKHFSSTIL